MKASVSQETPSEMGWTIRDFLLMNAPSVPPQDQPERPLERLARVCKRALLCPERTCTAVKSHTEKGENGEKYFGKTEARCLSGQGEKLCSDLLFTCYDCVDCFVWSNHAARLDYSLLSSGLSWSVPVCPCLSLSVI